ncbi:hypothetical protein ANCCAN_09215 [Ancylostoma caninum]|uniref:Uncharacterized protein n=1 Tax=Ancylostoma caninum TaxID=29170 RepID=A0A368GK88_ANCCA|nr:hypothetical protein ANCCAN_09215 [Ancylostoma caninum]
MHFRWKTETDPAEEVSARSAEKGEKSFKESSAEAAEEAAAETLSQEKTRIAEIKRRAGIPSKTEGEKSAGTETTMTEVQILLIRIEELELANRKAGLQMKRLRKQLRRKEKKIEELNSIVAFLQRSAAKEEEHDEKPVRQILSLNFVEVAIRSI